MTKYTRLTGKVFGSSATATGDDPEIGQFGSALAGTYNGTTDVSIIQSLPAWQKGFISAVTPSTQFPPLPEMTGFGKVLSHQICYLLQQGVPEYDSGTTYYTGNWCSYNNNLYIAKVDGFSNIAPTDTTKWDKFTGGFSRNYGEIVTSSLPLTDNTLHLADGSLLSQQNYPDFLSYISSIYVPPTVTNYYCWYDSAENIKFYTLSTSPNVTDTVYIYDSLTESFSSYGTVYSKTSSAIIVERGGRYYTCARTSTYDTSQTIYTQNYFTSEADWQATYTTYGECGKYVYNSTNNTVRIPLYNSYLTNTVNPQNLGTLTEASLPNIKGVVAASEKLYKSGTSVSDYGAFNNYAQNVVSGQSDNNNFDNDLWNFDASRSSSVYKDSATTVNTQSIKQLVYIVVAK